MVKNTLDASGDLANVESKKNAAAAFSSYANTFTYNAAGSVTSMKLGNNLWESTLFNSRLQPYEIRLGTGTTSTAAYDKLRLEYSYGSANNGNVQSQTITVPGLGQPFVQNYTYDALNRLASATETNNGSQTWKQTYTFDRYGNRRFDFANNNTTVPAAGCPEAVCNPTISTANNRLTSAGWNYDASGNTTTDAEGRSFTYDSENKQVKVMQNGGDVGVYSYDGDGKRVKKVVPSTGETTIFVYDAMGRTVAEYSTVVAAPQDAKVNFTTDDHLGSPRINTDRLGNVIARHDYMPFGEEINAGTGGRTSAQGYGGQDNIRQKFTGYERDEETDLDFAQARYNSSNLGRFSSPDPFDAVSTDLTLYQFNRFLAQPQNWNKYTYCLNNPFRYVDMDGRHPVAALLLALAARAATGAAIGAVVVGGIELMTQMIMGGDINWDRVRNAAIAGAIGGAITGGASAIPMATFRGLAGKLAVAGVSNGVEGVVQRGLNGEENNIASILTDVLTGAIAYGATKHANELLDRSSKIATQDSVSKISQHYRVSDPPVFGSYIRQNRAMQYRNLRTFREFGSDTLTNTNGEVMEQIFPNVFQWKPKGNAKLETDVRMTRICDENGKNCEDVQ